jgi:hypothetical protein
MLLSKQSIYLYINTWKEPKKHMKEEKEKEKEYGKKIQNWF